MLSRYLLTYNLELPEYYDRIEGKRSENLVNNRIEVVISANLGEKIIRELALRENIVNLSLKSKEIVTIAVKIPPENFTA